MNSFNRLLSLYIDLFIKKYYLIIIENAQNFVFSKKMPIFAIQKNQ